MITGGGVGMKVDLAIRERMWLIGEQLKGCYCH